MNSTRSLVAMSPPEHFHVNANAPKLAPDSVRSGGQLESFIPESCCATGSSLSSSQAAVAKRLSQAFS
eukprot:scaffold4384_cov180-Ochromonas_danica.AAC.2